MSVTVNLYSMNKNEIKRFLNDVYNEDIILFDDLKWERSFLNPIELADIIGIYIDNTDKYDMSMWINLDADFLLHVTEENSDKIIRYLFERYPY